MKKLYPATLVALLILLSSAGALAVINGTHTWKASSAPDMRVPNLIYDQSFTPPNNPPITAGIVHNIVGVSYAWDVYVCLGVQVPPVAGTGVGSGCQSVPNPATMGVYVELCRLKPGSSFPTCVAAPSKSGWLGSFNNETYTSSATKFFLRYRVQQSPVGVNGHVYVTGNAKINVGFSAY